MKKYSDTDLKLQEYLDGTLGDHEKQELEKELANSDSLRKRLEEFESLERWMSESAEISPPAELDWEFKETLESMKSHHGKSISWLHVAAAIVFAVIGYAIGVTNASTSGNENLTALNEKVDDLQKAVMLNTLKDHSTSEKLQVVNRIEGFAGDPDDELVETLVSTLTKEKSPNVRYAAVQALGKFMHSEKVRMELVRALDAQSDPLIQISMINLLVEAEEKAAINSIKKLLKKEETSEEVRRQGQIAIDILI